MTAHINIGTNMGNRKANLGRAVALLANLAESPLKVSAEIESEPWGFKSKNKFLNIGVELDTNLAPEELLSELKKIETEICDSPHRNEAGEYIDRTIDLDLIFYGNLILDTPTLVLPHPRLHMREFVLKPLAELSPQWIHPLLGKTPTELLQNLNS